MNKRQIIEWLLQGDISIQYQVNRDLLGDNNKNLQNRIDKEGWGKILLSKRNSNGHWGEGFYQPKWISTHYSLLDFRNLNPNPKNKIISDTIYQVLNSDKALDGGIQLGPSTSNHSDVCVNAMFLNYASYFRTPEKMLFSLVDSILNEKMNDGGFNCRTTRSGAKHSSLHTTISVLEGLYEFQKSEYNYRFQDVQNAIESSEEFILKHRLFLSDRTGQIIHKDFLKMPYPSRWKYDIIRALDYFQYAGRKWDKRMSEAIEILITKKNKNGTWNMQAAHPGQVHFVMEKAGAPGRCNTLRAMRILKYFKIEI